MIEDIETTQRDPLSTVRDGDAFVFGEFRLVPAMRSLSRDGRRVHMGGRAHDILIALIERAGQIVSKEELFSIVWPATFIEESNLRVHVAALRKALGDGVSGTRFIVSVPGRGYIFVADVKRVSGGGNGVGSLATAGSSDRDYSPVPLATLIGRDEIVDDVVNKLSSERLVTITGTGGVGKTAVALAVVERLRSTFRDDVQIVDLGSLTCPTLVIAHLASVLRLPRHDTEPLQYVIAHLLTQRMLIVFDNCDQVIETVGAIAEMILRVAPEVYILATSRQPLRAMGEWVQRLNPLPTPRVSTEFTAAEVLRFPAVQLFVERASANGSGKFTDSDALVVAEVCTKLDGLPLAIELAAARVAVLGLRRLADRLDDRFSILTKGRRTAHPRHQALEAMIDWSYETLNETEKIVWRRLAVFGGAFTIEAAATIGNVESAETLNIVDILDNLVEKSLVSTVRLGGTTKYKLLESLRLYALKKRMEHNETECVRRHPAQHERAVVSSESHSDTLMLDKCTADFSRSSATRDGGDQDR